MASYGDKRLHIALGVGPFSIRQSRSPLRVLAVSKRPPGSALAARTRFVSGRDRSDQGFDPDNVHDPCQIVGQNR